MYFGSVKFFKHLILTVVFGWIGVATVLAVFFGIKCHMMSKDAENAGTQPSSVSAYIDEMTAAGYSYEDILAYIQEQDSEAFETFTEDSIPALVTVPDETVSEETVPEITAPSQTTAETEESIVLDDVFFEEEPVTEDITENMPADNPDSTLNPSDEGDSISADAGSVADYTALYPELYAQKAQTVSVPDANTVFITFDDGPSENTYDILYILNRQNVKATFFMSAGKTEDCREQMRAVAEAGHTIGVHSFSHDADVIYRSVEDYLADFYDTYKMIYDATGVMPQIYRLPDEELIPEDIKAEIISEMDRRGFTRFGSNADTGDRDQDRNWQHIYDTSLKSASENTAAGNASVLHFHDSADDYITVLTVEDVITGLKEAGFTFAALDAGTDICR